LGGFGPSIAGLAFVFLALDKDARRDFWQRLVDFKRINRSGILLAVLVPPALWAAGLGLDLVLGGHPPAFSALFQGIAQPALLIQTLFTIVFFGPLSEELGWRGYALDQLQARFSSLTSNLLLAALWAFWHLPLFWVPGSDQNHYGLFTLTFWAFFLYIPGLSFLIHFAYNQNNRSTLAAIILHVFANLVGTLAFPYSGRSYLFVAILFWLTAAALWQSERRRSQHPFKQKTRTVAG
jgi:uncharacterized protein